MPKDIQHLIKRNGSIHYFDNKLPIDDGVIKDGDTIRVHKEDNQIDILVDAVQEDETVIGTVKVIGPVPTIEIAGLERGDIVVIAKDFIHTVTRKK